MTRFGRSWIPHRSFKRAITTLARPISEPAITISDTARVTGWTKQVAEPAVSVSDTARVSGTAHPISEPAINISDTATAYVGRPRPISEPAIGISDSASAIFAPGRTATEPAIAVSDTATRGALSFTRTAALPKLLAHANGIAGGAISATSSPIDTTGATALVAIVATGAGFPTISDTYGNTWQGQGQFYAGDAGVQAFVCFGPTVGAGHQVTASVSSGGFPSIVVLALANTRKDSIALDVSEGSTAAPIGTVTAPKDPNEVTISAVVGFMSGSESVSAGWTLVEDVPLSGGSNWGIAAAYGVEATPSSAGPTWVAGTVSGSVWITLRSQTDVVPVSDVAAPVTANPRTVSEPAIAISDTATAATGHPRQPSEPAIGVSDATSRGIQHFVRTVSEPAIAISDVATQSTILVPRPVGAKVWIRERPPLKLFYLVTTPDGQVHRWSDDAPQPENVVADASFSSAMSGGYENWSAKLARRIGVDYPDLQEFARINAIGLGGDLAWQGRLEKQPDTTGAESNVSPSAVGYQAALEDDASAQMIPVDRDLSAWIDSSSSEKVYELDPSGGGFGSLANGSVTPDNAGDPALRLSFTGPWTATSPPLAESWYDGNGVPIGSIHVGLQVGPATYTGMNIGDTTWSLLLAIQSQALNDPAAGVAFVSTANLMPFPGAVGSMQSTRSWTLHGEGDGLTWGLLAFSYPAAGGTSGTDYDVDALTIAVFGDHGLPLQGQSDVYNALGVLGSDVVAYAVGAWAPELALNIQQPTGFIIPHLVFKDQTTVSEIVKQSLRFDLFDWWVDEGPQGWIPTFNIAPRDEHGRKWRARVWPSKLQNNGPDVSRIWNGVAIGYTDVSGNSRFVGPAQEPSLFDSDPENPVNKAIAAGMGGNRIAPLKMLGTATYDQAVQTAALFLQEQKTLDTSGQAELNGWVQGVSGTWYPAWLVKAGDQISFIDARDTSYRRIVHAAWDDTKKSNTIQLDQPPDALKALLERLSVVLVPLGLT